MEEAKSQENEKLQSALQDMQVQFKETKAMLEKEREAVRRAEEKVPIIQEVPVVDHAMMEKLTNENEKLKVRCPKVYDVRFVLGYYTFILRLDLAKMYSEFGGMNSCISIC